MSEGEKPRGRRAFFTDTMRRLGLREGSPGEYTLQAYYKDGNLVGGEEITTHAIRRLVGKLRRFVGVDNCGLAGAKLRNAQMGEVQIALWPAAARFHRDFERAYIGSPGSGWEKIEGAGMRSDFDKRASLRSFYPDDFTDENYKKIVAWAKDVP